MDENNLQQLIKSCKKTGWQLLIIGFVWSVIFIAGLVGILLSGRTMRYMVFLIWDLILLVWGIFVTGLGVNRFLLIRHFRIYAKILNRTKETTVDDFASATGIRRNVVNSEIRWLTKKGFFGEALFDRKNGRLTLLDSDEPSKASQTAPTMRTVNCPYCGGLNQLIIGKSATCAYCDRTIFDGAHWGDS